MVFCEMGNIQLPDSRHLCVCTTNWLYKIHYGNILYATNCEVPLSQENRPQDFDLITALRPLNILNRWIFCVVALECMAYRHLLFLYRFPNMVIGTITRESVHSVSVVIGYTVIAHVILLHYNRHWRVALPHIKWDHHKYPARVYISDILDHHFFTITRSS